MLKIYFRTLVVTWKIYGPSKAFFAWLLAEPLLKFFTFSTLFADRLFFPGFQKIEVKKPLFILGHPRSGTTFLHHLLTQTDDAAPFQTWHLFFPALTGRLFMKPLVNFLIKIGKTEVMPEETGHKMELNQTDEEEMLFLHNYDTNFVTIGMLSLDDREYPELRCHDEQPRDHRLRSMRFLDGCFKRHIYDTGRKQIIAQTHFSTFRLKTMLEFYPDAKFVFVMRNPHQVIPSFFSLLHNSIEYRWGLAKIPSDVLGRYNERRYQDMLALYRYFYELQQAGELPKERVMVLPYELLRTDLETAFARVARFSGITVSDELHQIVAERAKSQQKYHRTHQVKDLAEFGLNHQRISEDFHFVFAEYGIEDKCQ
ncbi:MAG: sulfotransferase [Proteobacteria bacterium]|nr:sulfotransferase [Pseudomonadota bacterium]MBU1640035.1 sulfotransferase [Pseudomonadota bacterium]